MAVHHRGILMDFIDAIFAMVFDIVVLIFWVVATYWYIVIPMLVLVALIYIFSSRCPRCKSFKTEGHSSISSGVFQADWFPEVDPETGDIYAVRYDRSCRACGHMWISGIDSSWDDPRPIRKKISDRKSWEALEDRCKKSAGRVS